MLAQLDVLQMFLIEKSAANKDIVTETELNLRILTYFETPILPNVRVRDTSGRIQARSARCCGVRIQSSQKDFGHLTESSVQRVLESIQPSPGKKSVRYRSSGRLSSIRPTFPLSFHADTHHRLESFRRSGYVAWKYSKKSGDTFRSSGIDKDLD